mgnify:FL=1|jgi:hypothetical protein
MGRWGCVLLADSLYTTLRARAAFYPTPGVPTDGPSVVQPAGPASEDCDESTDGLPVGPVSEPCEASATDVTGDCPSPFCTSLDRLRKDIACSPHTHAAVSNRLAVAAAAQRGRRVRIAEQHSPADPADALGYAHHPPG